MKKPSVEEMSKIHKHFASKCNNEFWSLSERELESSALPKLLSLSFASLYHWSEVGTEENVQLANLAVARALCLNDSLRCVYFAQAAYNYFDENGADWIQAFTNAVLSHALLISKNRDKAIELYEKALRHQLKLSDGDRGIFDATFKLIPDPRV